MSSVSNYLIGIHVRLSTRTGLPYYQRELIIQLSIQNLITNLSYHNSFVFFQNSQFCIRESCRFFQDGKCPDYFNWHSVLFSTNFEIIDRSLSLGSPIFISRNLNRPHGIMFDSYAHIFGILKLILPKLRLLVFFP